MSQSSNDYELLVIDDGSTDHTGAIAGNMAEKNSSISIVRIPHSGAGAARNEGVGRARGKYVIFLDADDYWTNPGLLEYLREKLHHREVDVVMSQMDKYTENEKLLKKYRKGPFPSDKEFYRLKEVYEALVSDGQVRASSCNKCVRRSLLEDAHIAFQEGGFAEDIDWVLQLFSHVETDYWVCIDSDDWLADDAVDIIYRAIRYSESKNINISDFVGLDAEPDGKIYGGRFPQVRTASLMDLEFRYKHQGDIKAVYRTAASAPFLPMPEISGEKNFNPYYIMLQMDREAPLLVINQVLCIVDYQPDGMSSRVFRQYEDSPVSFGMLRLQFRQMPDIPFWFRYRQCMHYVSSWLFAVKQHRSDLRAPFFIGGMLLAFLPGVLLHLYIIFRNRRDHK